MKKFTIKATCAALALVLGVTAFTGCGAKETKVDGSATFATVDGVEIPAGVASFAVRYQQAQSEYYYASMFASMYGTAAGSTGMWNQEYEEGVSFGDMTRDTIIEDLAKMYIVREKADEYAVEITEEESAAMDEAAKAFVEANDAATLELIGVTESDVKEYLELTTYYNKAFMPVVEDVEIVIEEEEAAQSSLTYAFKSTNDMEDAEKEEVYTMMEGLLEDIKASEDPATVDMITMAEELDESIITMLYTYGAEGVEADSMDENLRATADKLADGEVYDGIVEGEAGYFVVRKEHEYDEEASADKMEELFTSKQQDAFAEIVQGWYDEASIEITDGMLDLLKITDQKSFTMKTAEAE